MKYSLLKPNKHITPQKVTIAILALLSLFYLSPGTVQAKSLRDIFLAIAWPAEAAEEAPATNIEKFPVADDRDPVRKIWVIATAYSSEVAQTDDTPCIPANGYNLCTHYDKTGTADTIAANFLPFETQIRIPGMFGDKMFTVRDRMNAKYNFDKIGYYRIDLWMPNREAAVQFGVKRFEMEIYGRSIKNWRLAEAKK